MLVTFLELDIIEPNRSPEFEQASSALLPLDKIVSKLSVMWTVRDVRWFLEIMHLLSSFLYSLTTSASASLFELTAGLASALPSPLSLHLQQLGSGGFSLFSSYGNTWGE